MAPTLVAGFGNVLRGDDGFGIEVVRRLHGKPLPGGTVLLEVGTGGIALVQELLTRYERLIVVDAMHRGGSPGSVYLLRVDAVEPVRSVDMHLAVPARALSLASALRALPAEVFLVGCEPERVDDLTMELSSCVRIAVDRAVREVERLLACELPLIEKPAAIRHA
jgi:hydrogenase maturation protease